MSFLKSLMPALLKQKIKRAMGLKTMADRLLNLRRAGFHCTGAVDVGAYHGDWMRELRQAWPVDVLMVEPQPQCAQVLQQLLQSQRQPPTLYACCALGSETGTATFQLEATNSRLAGNAGVESLPTLQVPVRRLDDLLSEQPHHFNLLKVDVQGSELDVLSGAGQKLSQFEVIILEVSLIQMGVAPSFHEVMQYMHERGYRLYDFLPMYYRPLDNALWQGDAFFVRNDSSLVSSREWA